MKRMKTQASHRYLGIAEVGELVRQGEVSSVDLVTACLKRIGRLNPILNAFITVTAERAMGEAKLAEREIKAGKWKGPLHGVPVGVKDMFDTAGVRTTAAFACFADRVPRKDAEVVTKLKEAGAIVVGKTTMHELAMGTTSVVSHFGSVHNPWNQDHVAGGSSGGSAAAVAAGLCYATVDTDAIGSCRLQAACCGVTGFKATHGLISTKGILEGETVPPEVAELLTRIGHTAFMCRAVEDVPILLNALATSKADYRLALDTSKKPRIGIVKAFKAMSEVRTVFANAIETFRSLGHATIDIDAPLPMSHDVQAMDEDRKSISHSLFKEIDVLVLPTTTDVTPTIEVASAKGPLSVSADNTYFCNYYGLPAISVPCGFTKKGLPLGLQVVGPHWGEAIILDVAYRFQRATKWHLEHPIDQT